MSVSQSIIYRLGQVRNITHLSDPKFINLPYRSPVENRSGRYFDHPRYSLD